MKKDLSKYKSGEQNCATQRFYTFDFWEKFFIFCEFSFKYACVAAFPQGSNLH